MSLFNELRRRNVIRVAIAYLAAAWLLVEVTDTIFPYFRLGETAVRILIILLAIGFPLFLVFSWVFELTPEGLRLEKDVRREKSVTRKAGKRLDRAIIVLLILAVGYFAVDKFVLEPARVAAIVEETAQQARSDALVESNGEQSIAVLPFVNVSPDPEQEYFSDGITEEILNHLAGIRGLRVAARTSVFSFKDQNQDVREIARKLGVGTVLEGSVRRVGDDLRITAQLIRASDGFHLWSETYDRKLENVFAIQEDIASRIAEALQVSMGVSGQSATQAGPVDPEVYDLYLRARAMHRQRGAVLLEAVALFEQALAIDPDFAPAWAGLSHTYIVIPNYISEAERARLGDVLGKSLAAAERALELDPDLPTATHAMANNLFFRFEWAEAERLYRKALELDPDSTDIMEDYVTLLTLAGQLDTARPVAERMIELDPYVPVFHNALVALLWAQGESELAEERIRIALDLNPNLPNIQIVKLTHLLSDGRYDEAREYSGGMSNIRYSPEELLELIDWLENGARSPPGEKLIGALDENPSFSYLAGRYDLWLESITAAGKKWPEWYMAPLLELLSPTGDAEKIKRFRSDPRTKAYIESMRLPEYWRQVGWPEMCRPVGGEDFACY